MKELIFASHNANKVAEIARKLEGEYKLLSLTDIGCHEEIVEDGARLEENARIKARYVFEHYGKDCFADDTGLEVKALDGAPGVHTARYAGEEKDNGKNMAKLLSELEGEKERSAQFRTVICAIVDGEEYLFEGVAKGSIGTVLSGDKGFGYDPIFYPEGYEITFAEMDMETKNSMSHRGKAVEKLIHFLKTNA